MKPLVKQACVEGHSLKKKPPQPDSKRKARWKARSSYVSKW